MGRLYKLILAAVFLIGIGLFFLLKKNKQYDYISPKTGPINEAIYGLGTVKTDEKFAFKVAIPKTIKQLYVKEGEFVSAGQKLLAFDDGTVVKSPIQGTVSNLPASLGENVFTDRPVVEIENLNKLFIEAVLDQQSTMRVKRNENVKISFESHDNATYTGKITSLYPSNGQFLARLEVRQLPPHILPGMTADLAIEVDRKENALLIPVRAIQMGVVLIERNGRQQKVDVKVGIMDQEWAEVISNTILPTDKILVKKAL
ncbi:MAG: efflux RND transporter periplasmic adaptor subunit [Pseudobdellovibrio sp.]